MQSLKKNWLVVSNICNMRIWWIFTQPCKSPKISLQWLFLFEVYDAWAKKYRGVIFHDTEQWCKIWKTLTLWFPKWHEELGELSSLEHSKVWKLYIDGLFLSKAYTVSVRKFQRNYVSWHWRVLQSLNENWLVAWEMT